MKWENSTKDLTLEEAIDAYKHGIAVIVNDGRDITLEIETVPTSKESTRRN